MSNVISAVYDNKGMELYRGRDEDELKRAVDSVGGDAVWRMYHKVGNSVCVNECSFIKSERTGWTQIYVRGSEIEILAGVLDGRLA